MHKKYKDYVKTSGEKEKKRGQVPKNSKRRVKTNQIMKKALGVWGNSSRESEEFAYIGDASMLVIK